jgi:hypothetical protein
MGEGEEDVVGGGGAGAAGVDLGVDAVRAAEQRDRLVDEVGAEVEEDASGVERVRALLPPARHLGTPAFETGLEAPHGAEGAAGDQPPDGAEVAVPAPVVVRDDRQAAHGRQRRQRAGLVGGRGDRLVHHDREAGGQRGAGEGCVLPVGRGDHDQVVGLGRLPQPVGAVEDPRLGIAAPHGLLPFGVPGDDGRQAQGGHRVDERCVEHRAAGAVADECHPQCHAAIISHAAGPGARRVPAGGQSNRSGCSRVIWSNSGW